MRALCPAKVNLALHVTGRRSDGYHLLESLVVFASVGDDLAFTPGGDLALDVDGPTAVAAGDPGENLVLRAAAALAQRVDGLRLGRFHLTKRLPVAAGLGGGSSDAAGALRLLAEANALAPDDARVRAAAEATGADVTVCLLRRPAMMRGIGHDVDALDMPPLPAVLVNPRVSVETRAVFSALGLVPGEAAPGNPHPDMAGVRDAPDLVERLRAGRNDLAPAARQLAPVIAEVESALAAAGAVLVRMSGSGATVVGLFGAQPHAEAAAAHLSRAHPDWWVCPAVLGTG